MPELVIQITENELNVLDHQLQSIWTGRADPKQEQERLFLAVHSTVRRLIEDAYELGKLAGKASLA